MTAPSLYKVPEGFGLTEWPEFKAMVARWGLPEVPENAAVVVVLPHFNVRAYLLVNGQAFETCHLGKVAFGFPETQDWLARLGVPTNLWVINLTVEFALGMFPTFTMRAALSDTTENHDD